MGHRELRRVPLDFAWPLGETWSGYLPPDFRPCPSDDCTNGYTFAGRWLECLTHLILIAGDAARHPEKGLHLWLQEVALAPSRVPGPDMAALTEGLAGRGDRFFGHDAIDRMVATRKIANAAGMPKEWGICQICHGHAIHPDDYEASETWEGTDPPTGDGYQLWETTSEGSPVSPVFESMEALAEWCAIHANPFGSFRWSRDEWLASFRAGTTDVDTLMTFRVPAQ